MSAIKQRLDKMETYFDFNEVVVIDNGTGFIKAGFAGEDLPRVVIPTVMGSKTIHIEQNSTTQQATKTLYEFGYSVLQHKNEFDLKYPIERGVVQDFESLEKIYDHIFEELNIDKKAASVLISDSPLNTKDNKVKLAQLMFEEFKVNSLALYNSSVLSLFSTGSTKGVLVESGQGVSHTVPVFQGYALPHAVQRLDIAGQDVTYKLIDNLKQRGFPIDNTMFEFATDMKEKMCWVAIDYDHVLASPDPLSDEEKSYELPDGSIIQIDHHCRFNASQILFQPKLNGVDSYGIAELAFDSIEKCDEDLKHDLYNNIVVAGGTSLIPGYKERLERDIKIQAQNVTDIDRIRIYTDSHRKYATWIGGSMIASFSTFPEMSVSRAEYDDNGDTKGNNLLKKTIF